MAVNKVVYDGQTLVDLTADTVTADTLAEGATAHDKSGAKITGTMKANTPTQFTNLYDPENVTVQSKVDYSSGTVSYATDKQCNSIIIPYHHVVGEPVVLRIRGIGTVRDRYGSATVSSDGAKIVKGYSFAISSTSYFSMAYDEHGDMMVTFKGNLLTTEWYFFAFTFQYIGTNANATVQSGPIITINEPIGNGGYAG